MTLLGTEFFYFRVGFGVVTMEKNTKRPRINELMGGEGPYSSFSAHFRKTVHDTKQNNFAV